MVYYILCPRELGSRPGLQDSAIRDLYIIVGCYIILGLICIKLKIFIRLPGSTVTVGKIFQKV